MNRSAIDWARDLALAQDPDDLTPWGVTFLLREYVRAGGDAVRAAVEHGLTRGLAVGPGRADARERMHWLRALAEGASVAHDHQLHDDVNGALPAAIDALEALVRRTYEPGNGLPDGSCPDHIMTASALLAGFDLSGRLPYAMLAEELIQHARRRWWRPAQGAFSTDFAADCTALHTLCRLAELHADQDYRSAAVIAPSSPYRQDARLLASSISDRSGEYPQHAGDFGGAMLVWFALESNLQ